MVEIEKAEEQMCEMFYDMHLRLERLNESLGHSPGTIVWKGKDKKYSYWQYYRKGKQYQQYVRQSELVQTRQQIQIMKEQKRRRTVLRLFVNRMKKALRAMRINWREVLAAYEQKKMEKKAAEYQRQTAQKQAKDKKYASQYKHATDRGDLVASKSEEIIANLLFSRGIRYEYEKPMTIGNWHLKPDFTVWRRDGTMLIWEHAGLMHLEDYAKKFRKKLMIYEEAGFVPQRNLIITMDENGAFSAEEARRMINWYRLD
ncbi:MAG: hypothetical protein HFE64_01585 [Lachnospiraceae bacterium]|nr:hypothetical protein [Lachnospiraceae bacterium]